MKTHPNLPFEKSHAFIIGINAYKHVSTLSTAVNDAKALAKKLEEDHGYEVHPPLLDASKKDMMKLFEKDFPEKVGANDRVLFYFAGHGIALNSDDDPKGYLVPADAKPGDRESLISMELLHQSCA
ncbi:MAG: caspase family protein, partial [Bacteroidota bacterium]